MFTCVEDITRGDLRFSAKGKEIEARLQSYIHAHPDEVATIVKSNQADYNIILSEILLLSSHFEICDEDLLTQINATYAFLTDSIFSNSLLYDNTLKTIHLFRQKFESLFK
jgi:hypothetical protein